jgi:hypothetical protein
MNEQRVALRQQRDLGQIIGDAMGLYTQNFWPLFSIAAAVIPLGIASAALQTAIDDSAAMALVLLALVVLQAAVNLLAGAALIAALGDIDAGRPPEFSRAYDVAFERFWTLVGAILRAAFHILLFAITIIGIPWAIQRLVRWLFIEQAVILDQTSARAALSYSADAVAGRWWRTLGIAIVIGIIGTVPASIIAGVFVFAPILVSGTVNAIVNAALLPFAVTAMTLLYCDLKVRKESDASDSLA